MFTRTFGVVLLTAALALPTASAQDAPTDYPSAPVRMISGFSAGGTVDLTARAVAQALTEKLGQNFLVENRTGANGMLAAQAVAGAPADGYTILVANSSSLTVNPLLYEDITYNVEEDFIPVAVSISHPLIMTINPQSPKMENVHTFGDFIELVKSKPGEIFYGTSGVGGTPHLGFEMINEVLGVDMQHIPYQGAAASEAALLQQEVDIILNTPNVVEKAESGQFRLLAVSSPERSPLAPHLPTVAEEGVEGFNISAWVAHLVPTGTPPEIVEKLNKELNAAALTPAVKKQLEVHGKIEQLTPEEFTALIRAETERYAAIIEAANITIQQ